MQQCVKTNNTGACVNTYLSFALTTELPWQKREELARIEDEVGPAFLNSDQKNRFVNDEIL